MFERCITRIMTYACIVVWVAKLAMVQNSLSLWLCSRPTLWYVWRTRCFIHGSDESQGPSSVTELRKAMAAVSENQWIAESQSLRGEATCWWKKMKLGFVASKNWWTKFRYFGGPMYIPARIFYADKHGHEANIHSFSQHQCTPFWWLMTNLFQRFEARIEDGPVWATYLFFAVRQSCDDWTHGSPAQES